MDDRYGIGKDKLEFLVRIGAIELSEPIVYMVGNQPRYSFSENYLKNTSIEKIKDDYDKYLNGLQ
jgi:hypothetical protein